MHLVRLDQPVDDRAERLGRQPPALVLRRRRDAELRGLNLPGVDAPRAVPDQLVGGPTDGRQLHPGARLPEHDAPLFGEEVLGVPHRGRRVRGQVARDLGALR